MLVLVTGASGFIGSYVVPELLAAGHHVTALVRSEASAVAVKRAGATPIRGTVDDLDVLVDAAASADAVINLAFRGDLAAAGRWDEAVAAETAAVAAMGEALKPGSALAIAAGTIGLAQAGVTATERDRPADGSVLAGRQAPSEVALALADRGVRSSVVRLAPVNHGTGDTQFVPMLINLARRSGVAAYPGNGSSRWPAVHVRDTARLFRLAIEVAPAGSILHAVAEDGIPVRRIAEAIGRHLDLPVESVPMDQVDVYFGFLAMFLRPDSPVSSALTREVTGWRPSEPGLLDDLENGGHYFAIDPARENA